MQYPQPDDIRSGCKVSWYRYKDETVAKKAAFLAEKEAKSLSAKGYDFGFMVPGTISKIDGDMFEVVIP